MRLDRNLLAMRLAREGRPRTWRDIKGVFIGASFLSSAATVIRPWRDKGLLLYLGKGMPDW